MRWPTGGRAGRRGEEGSAARCPALGQRGDAWRSGASRTHVSRRGDRPALLHVPGGPRLETTREQDPSANAKGSARPTPRSLPPGDLNPHHLVLGVLRVNFEGLPTPSSTHSHALPTTGVKAVLSVHGCFFLCVCDFHLEPPGVQHIVIWKEQTPQELGHSFYCFIGSGIEPKAYSVLGKYPQS